MFGTIYTILSVLSGIGIFVWIMSRPGKKSIALTFACIVLSIVSGVMWPLSWIIASIAILDKEL